MDALTGLPDRMEAFAQLEAAAGAVHASGNWMVVALVDLDGFYRVNESRGTDFGDYVLQMTGKRLSEARAANTLICRIGGNTFLVGMTVEPGESHSLQAVEAVKNAIERPIEVDGAELYLTSSIGATIFPRDGRTGEQLICRAESALYQSKELGGNRARFYAMEDTLLIKRRIDVEAALRPALCLRQFHLSYQPIYRVKDGRLRGFEALIRWHHPELGVISPAEFIRIAEQNGLIIPIGEWVLREACRMLSGMGKQGNGSLIMSINISPVQLQDPSFPRTVLHVLKEFGLSCSSLELEITENTALYASDTAMSTLSWLRAAGVRISLDDYGIGYSSLANLKQLPIQCLKLDKSFIRKIDVESAERIIVEGVISLVHKLGLEVIAEGVEFEEQYNLLNEWGCGYVQGYLLGKPMEPDVLDLPMLRRSELRKHSKAVSGKTALLL
ncbi:putative bifunctional diguanylate cyclase/phosphodiesterase [Paenibacillus vietnamensis]|uniref:putative bifunctional diguanylate cyclase/phosphodiesterase n=1 Tax=Paenibacillus vietnamensis TaxID=2590547 RepID=UPI001CD14143|nr:bifunctional diguanylate cyclase/phosphodiesterase [Paenibacillus vietnamensis]